MKSKLFLPAILAVLISYSGAATAAELSGVWYDVDGEVSLDLDANQYYGIDDGCKIDSIKSSGKNTYALKLTCNSEATGETKATAKLTQTETGLLLEFDQSRGGWTVEFVEQQSSDSGLTANPSSDANAESKASGNAEFPPVALEAWNAYKAPEAGDVFRWAVKAKWACYRPNLVVTEPCPFAHAIHYIASFPVTASNATYVIVEAHAIPDSGNAWEARRMIFRKDGKDYSFVREFDGALGAMTSASKTENGFEITTKTLQGNDARCCPTGETVWRVSLNAGDAEFVSGNPVGG